MTKYTFLSPIEGLPRITSEYGMRKGKFHRGKDIAGPPNFKQSVYWCRETVGGIAYVGYEKDGFGNFVYAKHDDGVGTIYAHLDSVSVKDGQRVSRDTEIGKVGKTGLATGPHVHFEAHKKYGAGFTIANSTNFTFNYRSTRTFKGVITKDRPDVIKAKVDLDDWWKNYGFTELIIKIVKRDRLGDVYLEMKKQGNLSKQMDWLKNWYVNWGSKEYSNIWDI